MKQWKLIFLSVVTFFTLLGGCEMTDKKTENQTKDVRKIAWDSLSDSEKKEVIGKWKEAQIDKMIASTRGFSLKDPSFDGQEVIVVIFRSIKSSLLGDIVILVDEKSGKVVGAGLRD